MRSTKYGLGLAVAAACMAFGVSTASAATEKVLPGDIDGADWSSADTRNGGTWAFTAGPATPPVGEGSLKLSTPGGTNAPFPGGDKVQILTDRYDNTQLSDITDIGYSAYRYGNAQGSVVAMAALNIRVSTDGDNTADAYMVFEPYEQPSAPASIPQRVWTDWDAYNGGNAEWWFSNGAGGCGQATPCTLTQINTTFPDAKVREGTSCGPANAFTPCPGSLGFNQGSNNPGTTTNVDDLYVSVSGAETRFDFEQQTGPAGNNGTTAPTAPTAPTGPTAQLVRPALRVLPAPTASRAPRASRPRR